MRQLATIFLTLISMTSFAQIETEENIIDIQLKECLDSTENQTTYGMIKCSIRAEDPNNAQRVAFAGMLWARL